MPSGRSTNNSVSSLEEQTNVITEISKKGSGTDPGEKKKSGKRSTPIISTATQTTSSTVTVTAGASLTQATVLSTAGPEAVYAVPQHPLPYPAYYPPQPYPFLHPADMIYPGFPTYHPEPPSGAEDWEEEPALSIMSEQVDARQGVHEMSSDEEESGVQVVPQEEDRFKTVNFDGLKKGKFVELLKTQHQKVKEEDQVLPPIAEEMAVVVNDFFSEPKIAGELERLAKVYPRIKNLDRQFVPRLDEELFTAVDQQIRNADVSLQNLQKGVMAAFSAMSAVGSLLISRGASDPELEALSDNVLDALHLLALVSNGLSTKRREQLRPSIQGTYAKFLSKAPDGSPAWLYGGNLAEAARKCELSKKIGEKILKGKQVPQKNAAGNQQQKRVGQGSYRHSSKRFRGPSSWGEQRFRQQNPRNMGYTAVPYAFPAPQQFQSYGYKAQGKQEAYQQPRQGFQQRGARK